MVRLRATAIRLLNLFRRKQVERALRDQIDAHAQMLEEDFLGRGMSPADTRTSTKSFPARTAHAFVRSRPREQIGCLYYSPSRQKFVGDFDPSELDGDVRIHYGRPGGVIPEAGCGGDDGPKS